MLIDPKEELSDSVSTTLPLAKASLVVSILSHSHQQENALVTPLLRSDHHHELSLQANSEASGHVAEADIEGEEVGGTSMSSTYHDPRFIRNPVIRGLLLRLLRMQSAADSLPHLVQMIVSNGKITTVSFVALYLVCLVLWLPFWLLALLVTEWGVYALSVAGGYFIGRCIIRMIAFPGASRKVSTDIEKEFAKYSVRMLQSGVQSFAEVASIMSANPNHPKRVSVLKGYTLPSLWSRAKTYRNRVLGVYLEVLLHIYQQAPESSTGAQRGFTKYGNNVLSGDIGNIAGLSAQAQNDGLGLIEQLKTVLALVDTLEEQAHTFLEGRAAVVTPNDLPEDARRTAQHLLARSQELTNFVSSLKPPSDSSNEDIEDESEEDLTVDAVRRKLERQHGSTREAIKKGIASVIPLLDPPPHNSIFSFDLQRGCMLSRYRGARQLWVRRPSGGMLDVLHFPARDRCADTQRNSKALLYCNPNAGLVEVAAGMSLVGGNVPSNEGNEQASDGSWVDFYTSVGIDVYVFNYAGYGRSFGSTTCLKGNSAIDSYTPGILPRLIRIIRSTFLTFTPNPDTLRDDGFAVAVHLLKEVGIKQLIIHGESIGGMAASSTARRVSHEPELQDKLALLICDRTFCNLEAVAQRLVGGWTGNAIRMLAPFWSTDVAGDFFATNCPKIVANDAADAIISNEASLKSGISLWKELHRGIASTKGIGWMTEAPLQYRMADWENVCVNDSKYVTAPGVLRSQAPTWPHDKHISVEEAFHFAACCKRIGKYAKAFRKGSEGGDLSGLHPGSRRALMEAWQSLACLDGLTGAPLGVAVKQGFDTTVAWLCSFLIFGAQSIVAVAERRTEGDVGLREQLAIVPSDFDSRPAGFAAAEEAGMVHPKPLPEVIESLLSFQESGDPSLRDLSHEFQFVVGVLKYLQGRLSASTSIEAAQKSRKLQVFKEGVGFLLNLHCGHNNPFSKEEQLQLKGLLDRAIGVKGGGLV